MQLLPRREPSGYAGAAVEVLESLDGRLPVRREASIVPYRETPPSPLFERNGHRPSQTVTAPSSIANGQGQGQGWTSTHQPLKPSDTDEKGHGRIIDGISPTIVRRKHIFLRRERWKALQEARGEGMSLRSIERNLGIHKAITKKYLGMVGEQIQDREIGTRPQPLESPFTRGIRASAHLASGCCCRTWRPLFP